MGSSVKVICHSRAPNGEELITLEVEFQRFILSEVNTHRSASRNYSSSRAIPVAKMIDQVLFNPAMPVHWGKTQAGMVAEEELQGGELTKAQQVWLDAARSAVDHAQRLLDLGVHKQVANRIIEPYTWTKGVLTTTKRAWEGILFLRLHKDAQPEFRDLASKIKVAIDDSKPKDLRLGEYHLPYVYDYKAKGKSLENSIKTSVSCCAQVSYRKLDDSLEKALKIYDMLNFPVNGVESEDPPHCYDKDTEVLTSTGFVKWSEIKSQPLVIVNPSTGQYNGVCYDYNLIKHDVEERMFHFKGSKIDLMITQGHQLYGSLIDKESDRINSDFKLFKANEKTSAKSKVDFLAQRPMKMLKSAKPLIDDCIVSDSEYAKHELIGFFIGDGSLPTGGSINSIKFHLLKNRKISYLKDLCERIEGCSLKESKGGHFTVKLKGALELFSTFVTEDKHKTLPVPWCLSKGQELVDAIYKGLKNSDGSVKRKAWTYSTSSEQLKEDLLSISPVFGYNITISRENVFENPKHNTNWILNFSNNRSFLVNDSRTSQTVELVDYKGTVYCADTGNNVLIIKRNNKIVLSGNCSPAEHVAKVAYCEDNESGNFHSGMFWQYRKALEENREEEFIYEQ